MIFEKLSEETEKRNKEIISDIVGKAFSLRKDSLEKFNDLLQNREIAPEFDFVDKDNLRFVKEVEVANEGIDKSFNIFNGFFGCFGIDYKSFIDNHVIDGKNKVKIQKFIFNKLSTEPDNFMDFFNRFIRSDLYSSSFCNIIIGDKLYTETGEHKNPIENIDFEIIRGIKYSKDEPDKVCFKFRKKETETTIINLITPKEKMFDYINKDVLRNIITKIYEKIGESKAPTRKLYLVISLNFTDWLLCSTSEEWGSCLNLESNYDCAYWKGLPGLIEDKNRCMIYLTDGTKKNYHGIETYHIIARTWALLIKTTKDDKARLNLVRSYPNSFNFLDIMKNLNVIDLISRKEIDEILENKGEVKYPYTFDGLYMDIGEKERWWVLTIYGDNYGLKYDYEKKKFYWDYYSSGCVEWFIEQNGEITDDDRVYISYEDGLENLLENGDELKNYWE